MYILADDKDCRIVNEVKDALTGWGLLSIPETAQEAVDAQAAAIEDHGRRIKLLETTPSRPGIAPRHIIKGLVARRNISVDKSG